MLIRQQILLFFWETIRWGIPATEVLVEGQIFLDSIKMAIHSYSAKKNAMKYKKASRNDWRIVDKKFLFCQPV